MKYRLHISRRPDGALENYRVCHGYIGVQKLDWANMNCDLRKKEEQIIKALWKC